MAVHHGAELLARRQAELEAAWAEEVAPVTVDSEPVGIDAQARASRLQAIIGEIKRTLARERTAALQAVGSIGVGTYLSGSATNAPVIASFDDLWAGPTP